MRCLQYAAFHALLCTNSAFISARHRAPLNTMAEHLEKMEDEDLVEIASKDSVLKFQLGVERVVLAAEGNSWRSVYVIPAGGDFR